MKEQTVIRELKIEELKAENELIEDEREELEDALEDLEGLDEVTTNAAEDGSANKQRRKLHGHWMIMQSLCLVLMVVPKSTILLRIVPK